MENVLNILKNFGKEVFALLTSLCDAINSLTKYLFKRTEMKQEKEKNKEKEKHIKEIEDVVDNGSIEDLLDLKKVNTIFFIFALFAMSGCTNMTQPSIQVTKPWEGHYKNTNDFYTATKEIQLEKNESIWVLSNRTLKRVLENNK